MLILKLSQQKTERVQVVFLSKPKALQEANLDGFFKKCKKPSWLLIKLMLLDCRRLGFNFDDVISRQPGCTKHCQTCSWLQSNLFVGYV